DISLSVAVGVEGLTGETMHWEATQYEWWTRVDGHDIEAERLARGVMIAQELAVLGKAPHSVRILDGSHITLVIQLNTALTTQSEELRQEAKRVWNRLKTIDMLTNAVRDERIIAMPKYDSSRTICNRLQSELGSEIPGDDKYLLGLILRPGEMLIPQQVPDQPWASLHFNARTESDEEWAQGFEQAINPLKERKMKFTYFKPTEFSPAFRIEFKSHATEEFVDKILATLASQITGPFIREPFPQYLADVMAKSVGLGLSALQTAVQLSMSGKGRPEIAELLIHSYRTEGV
ncbi:DNA double-strand break repair nuclease NurA, partial [Chloroflexota bacterium]